MVAAADHKFDVFIAFAPEDSGIQRTVRRILHEANVRTQAVYGESSLEFDPRQMDLCRNFLLLATPSSAASGYVRDQVGYWRDHRDMRSSFHILDVEGGAVRGSRTATADWYERLNIGPHGPHDKQPARIWRFAELNSPVGIKELASILTTGRMPKPEAAAPPSASASAPTTARLQPRSLLGAFLGVLFLALLSTAWISTRSLLESHQHNGLGPADAPAAVASIVSIGTVIGVLVGGTLTGLAKLVQARGQKDADLVRANAEMVRAQADMVRAKAGLPAIEGTGPAARPAPFEAEQPAP